MAQNWISIVESNWIFSKLYQLIYIYIYIIFMPNELFLVIKKKAHKYKIIQTLSSSNFIYNIRYMIMFFMIYLYCIPRFLHKLTHLAQKLKNFD